ncbi:MAG: hypothetical protein U5L45_01175 [Saprospiraceae bacterium]|nr:hypothetical protein [Saprospiraceae bacterium]
MKKSALLFLIFMISLSTFAQNARDKVADKIKIQRIAFITQRLSLTEIEAQQFWPIYNDYTQKLQQIRKQPKLEKPMDELENADVEKMILGQFDRQTRELEFKKEYFQKLKAVISVKKIAKLYRAEKDFRVELERQLQDMREMKQNRKRLRRE